LILEENTKNCPFNFFSGPDDVIQKSLYPQPLMTSPPKKLKPTNSLIFLNQS